MKLLINEMYSSLTNTPIDRQLKPSTSAAYVQTSLPVNSEREIIFIKHQITDHWAIASKS